MSKLLATLDAELAKCADEASRGELLARKAGHLARLGSFDDAQSLITQLRSQFGNGQSPRVSIWIMLAEGLLHTFREMSDEGADRIMRANVLASAARDRRLLAATSVWRAHTQSERSEFRGMVRSLDNALANSESGDHEVLARVYMTLANARMSVGDRVAANELFMFSRHHALECGDQATIDALMYNKAAFALAWLRARRCMGERSPELLRQLRLELASAKTYQQMVGVSALNNFVYLWEARLLLLADEHEAAIGALRAVRSMQPFARYNFHESLVDLEIGYCLVQKGQLELVAAQVTAAMEVDLGGLHNDDKLVAAWARLKILEALPNLGDVKSAGKAFEAVRDEFVVSCEDLRVALDGLGPHAHIVRPTVAHPRAAL
jgi:tetratricopeptide (TPR) repeat protein